MQMRGGREWRGCMSEDDYLSLVKGCSMDKVKKLYSMKSSNGLFLNPLLEFNTLFKQAYEFFTTNGEDVNKWFFRMKRRQFMKMIERNQKKCSYFPEMYIDYLCKGENADGKKENEP